MLIFFRLFRLKIYKRGKTFEKRPKSAHRGYPCRLCDVEKTPKPFEFGRDCIPSCFFKRKRMRLKVVNGTGGVVLIRWCSFFWVARPPQPKTLLFQKERETRFFRCCVLTRGLRFLSFSNNNRHEILSQRLQNVFIPQREGKVFVRQRKKPARIAWTTAYRKEHKKDQSAVVKQKKRKINKNASKRSYVSASLEVLTKKRQ